jgi:hypothetical protein
LAWKNEGLTPTVVPVAVEVAHPLRPVLGTVFCGELADGTPWERSIRMVRLGSPNRLRVTAIDSDTAWIRGSMDESGQQLLISVAPRGHVGRFDGTLSLVYSDQRVPIYQLKVSGIVRRE